MGDFGYYMLTGRHQRKARVKKPKGMFQAGGGYQAWKLRRALKKGNYKDSKVHKFLGKVWTT